MLIRKILLALLFMALFAFPKSDCEATNVNPDYWLSAGSSNQIKYYLYIPDLNEAEKIYKSQGSNKIVSVWGWMIYKDGSNSKSLVQYDLNNKRFRATQIIYYDINGNVTSSNQFDYAKWITVIPETVGETNYGAVMFWVTY